MSRILVVDDEPQIARMLRTALQSSGYEVITASNGLQAFELVQQQNPDLIITDLAMPEMDGLELTQALRRVVDTPIIVLSVKSTDTMKVMALDEGADDYLTKPFNMPELQARVRAQLRRRLTKFQTVDDCITEGDFVIDTSAHSVTVRGELVHLTPKEFDLLLAFARSPSRVLTHRVLLRTVWGPAGVDQPDYLRVLVAQLRKKIESDATPRYVVSEPWVGYRFEPNG
ncbi:response regulator transcription factor [Granulicella cerasi]|uniref:Response regulator transcription factor n=1 Tax=Granulicella cerasi TaxID=741063 RepID=A0ABW1Z7G7_9BACT|nr:response regulator transcription factor [Granulicella cerasi]